MREENGTPATRMRVRQTFATNTATWPPRASYENWIDESERRVWLLS